MPVARVAPSWSVQCTCKETWGERESGGFLQKVGPGLGPAGGWTSLELRPGYKARRGFSGKGGEVGKPARGRPSSGSLSPSPSAQLSDRTHHPAEPHHPGACAVKDGAWSDTSDAGHLSGCGPGMPGKCWGQGGGKCQN